MGFAVYIKINLLPPAFRPKKILIKFDYKFVLTLVIILGALGVGGYYFYMKRTLEETKTQITFYRGEETKIRRAVALDKEVKELNKNIEERVNIIKELTGDSDVRFAMLEHINFVLPGNLWLLNINEVEENNKITFNIEGMSYSKDYISDFIAGLEKFEKPYAAFQEYQKLIDSYPNSQRINEAVEREYNIGEFFLNREQKQLLGMSWYDFVEHPAVEIFNTIVTKVPYSEYAPRAQYKLGMMFAQLGRYDEARDAFQKVIDNYS